MAPRRETAAERAVRREARAATNLSRAKVIRGRKGLSGIDEVLNNLNREVKAIKGRSKKGMRKAALIVRRRSVQLTPVDTGNLRNSAFTEVVESITGIGATIGYTASYATFVHEVAARHKPPTQWKFLETALQEKSGEVLKAIQDEARIK